MPSDPERAVTLTCHPETPAGAVRAFSARVRRARGEQLTVSYVLEGDLDRLRVPAPRAPRVAGRLWEHTCCEVFIARKGSPAYHEYNFSPSGEWATYAFDDYRAPRAGAQPAPPPQVTVRKSAGRLELDALIGLEGLAAPRPGARLALALSAVVEDSRGVLSYWALRHPPGKPDFHHSDAFALELDGEPVE